jgi:cellulose synthase/poly-beta-1,6-N-acetylglucosamine synthase-like glycosyltransferase
MTAVPYVSVIIPCRNEVKYIGACLDSLLGGDYPTEQLEILVVDGMSDDGTRAVVEQYARASASTRLVDNQRRVTPAALNVGIAQARGSVVMLMGAHAACSPTYISGAVVWLKRSGADAVGGLCIARPGRDNAVGRAIAAAVSHPFGVGNSYFRTGAGEPRWVDTVPFACYRREVFDRLGGFDEELVRDQDDEFNQRILRHGGRLLLVPGIASEYYVRESFGQLWRMFFQYGYFKPLVVRKVGGVLTGRQLVPALFVSTLLLTAALAPALGLARLLFALALGAYTAADMGVALTVTPRIGVRAGLALLLAFPVVHLSYGLGYVWGAVDFLIRYRQAVRPVTLSR